MLLTDTPLQLKPIQEAMVPIPDLVDQLRQITDKIRAVTDAVQQRLAKVADSIWDLCKTVARIVWDSLCQLAKTFVSALILLSMLLAPVFLGSAFHELTYLQFWGFKVIGWLVAALAFATFLYMLALIVSHKRSSNNERKQTTIGFHFANVLVLLILAVGTYNQYDFRSPILKLTQTSFYFLLAKFRALPKSFTSSPSNKIDSQPPITASFDCNRAKTATETAICADRDLASLDLSMVAAYHSVLDRLTAAERIEFKSQHLEWFKEYQHSCNAVAHAGAGANLKECIAKHLSEHTLELQARLSNGGAPVLPTGTAAPLANALAGTHWQGIVGNWFATLDIMLRQATGEWKARVTYRSVAEDLTVSVTADGRVVFTGTSYKRLSGEGPFLLDTFYGQLSGDGQHLQGLRVDAETRGQWSFSRT